MGAFTMFYMILGMILAGFFGLLLLTFAVISYILNGKALSTIARRRQIDRPWLAWIPIASIWLVGAISDQYRYVTFGQVRNRRTLLTWLTAALYLLLTLFLVIVGIWLVGLISTAAAMNVEAFMTASVVGLIAIFLFSFLLVILSAVTAVFRYIAYYDLFRSCDPEKRLVYLLVSIFVSVTLPFFLFYCRNKDLGMPPRQDAQ